MTARAAEGLPYFVGFSLAFLFLKSYQVQIVELIGREILLREISNAGFVNNFLDDVAVGRFRFIPVFIFFDG